MKTLWISTVRSSILFLNSERSKHLNFDSMTLFAHIRIGIERNILLDTITTCIGRYRYRLITYTKR